MDILASPPDQKKYEPLKFWFCDDFRPTVSLLAYLMIKYGWSPDRAHEHINNMPENAGDPGELEDAEEAEEAEEVLAKLSARG